MAKLAFCDYYNIVAILEKTEHNTDFHQIVDFLEASHIRYALIISPTVYVSHIRQFWSTARIETTNQETKILATADGKHRTISESSLRRHLKLNDEEGISSLPDIELIENLSLMGYNILPNQRFTFQKGQFSQQWKFLIHTIMQCLSPKSTGFNEFSSNIATAVVCLATNKGEGSANSTKPQHTPLPQKHHSPQHDSPPPSPQTIIPEPLPQSSTETLILRRYTRKAIRIDQDLEIFGLKARVKSLEDKERRSAEPTQEDAPITGGIKEIGDELVADKSTELGSNDTEEMVNVLSSIEAANILTSGSGGGGAAASVSHADVLPAAGVPTVSGSFSIASAIFTTTSVVTPYTTRPRGITIGSSQPMRSPIIRAKDKGKEKLARDSEIATLHAEEELKIMIEGLDRNNEVIAKYLREYEQAEANLSVGEKLELISELVKYQDHRAKIFKYQAHQSKPLLKKEQREF
nr:hypothetical protein [Tanacetum cinerariifolium]